MKQFSLKTLFLTTLLCVNTVLPSNPQNKVEQGLKTTVYSYLQKGTNAGKQAFNWGTQKIKQAPASILNTAKMPFQVTTYKPLFNTQTYFNNPGKTFFGVFSATVAAIAIYQRYSAIQKIKLENKTLSKIEQNKALLQATENNNVAAVKKALDSGADVNTQNFLGRDTALHIAADLECTSVVEVLLNNKNIDVNIKNGCGETALDVAARWEYTEIVNLLKKHMQK